MAPFPNCQSGNWLDVVWDAFQILQGGFLQGKRNLPSQRNDAGPKSLLWQNPSKSEEITLDLQESRVN